MDNKLVDLAYTKAEMKEEGKERGISPSGQPDPYPWGLAITLERNELNKLGVTDLPPVGTEVHLLAVAKVTSVNQSARAGEDEEARVGLQICMMQVLKVESPEEEKGEKETPEVEAKETKSIMEKY